MHITILTRINNYHKDVKQLKISIDVIKMMIYILENIYSGGYRDDVK